jgi:iron complex transport system ATP-binding protein
VTLALAHAGFEVDGRWLVRGIDVSLRRSHLVALVGANGSGKTSVIRLLAGLWTPEEGRALLDGRDLRRITRRDVARRIALVPQDTHLAFAFTVRDVVAMGRHAHLGRFERERPEDRTAIAEAMRRADVTHLEHRSVVELSGGERQRVLIARSLATEADHILLDEPTANLDVGHALDVLSLCRDLAMEGRVVAVALHDLNAAVRFASDVVLLREGRLEAQGPTRDVLTPAAIMRMFGVRASFVEAGRLGPLLAFDR